MSQVSIIARPMTIKPWLGGDQQESDPKNRLSTTEIGVSRNDLVLNDRATQDFIQ